jgi:hypothetical protein
MNTLKSQSRQASFFNPSHAKWVAGVLGMLIAVVGRDSLIGHILRQTRAEITSIEPGEL